MDGPPPGPERSPETPDGPGSGVLGRCDICGKLIDTNQGHTGVSPDFEPSDQLQREENIDRETVAEATAKAFEPFVETATDREVLETIREEGKLDTHYDCLEDTSFPTLLVDVEDYPPMEGRRDER